jgi:hypothetical protein
LTQIFRFAVLRGKPSLSRHGLTGPNSRKNGTKRFDPRILDRSVIAIPLLDDIKKDENEIRSVIIDVNLDYPDGRA